MPAARCYSGSRDQVKIDQKREYISVVVNSDLLTPNTCMLITQPFWYGVELCSLVCIQLCLSIIT